MQPALLESNAVARLWDSSLVVDRVTKVYRGGCGRTTT